MKATVSLAVIALMTALASARADITIDNASFGLTGYYSAPDPDDAIVSFDWDASNNLYFETATPDFTFGGFYKFNGASTSTLATGSSDFSGASVATVGNYVYYNTSDFANQKIYAYGPVGGPSAVTLVSTAVNFGLYAHGGRLFITGAPGFGTNHIFAVTPNGNGTLGTPADLGADAGSSGPLAFDAAGNLYYAPGFGDASIYKWSAAEVAAALADPTGHPITATGHLWLDYGTDPDYSAFSGGTSMLIDGQQLLLTLTNFTGPSQLVSFGVGGTGTYNGNTGTILESTDLLGQLQQHDGNVFVSDGSQIYQLNAAPEPSAACLLIAGGVLLFAFGRGRARVRKFAWLVLIIAAWTPHAAWAQAGPFSPAADQPNSTGISASDPNITGWATGVASITRGPVDITKPTGAKATFGDAANALGASDATADNPYPVVSLGDGGSITLSFNLPIRNTPGPDLAVFENGFAQSGVPNAYFFELATVAVSSDGVNFFTFPAVSLTQTDTQIGGFGTLDPTNIYNLAGSEIAGYGTPFDLQDLAGVSPLLDLNDITEVRITDVIGNVNTSLGSGTYTYDDAANPLFHGLYGDTDHLINDPFKTNFTTGGFDLDAVAEIQNVPEPSTWTCLLAGILLCGAMRRRTLRTVAVRS